MNTEELVDDAVELLQQLGLKEYEARCFVALSKVSKGTAKEIATIADVPKTRVYDSVRVLEARGLVEVQHTRPQRFRSVKIDEAVATLRAQYEGRIDRLTDSLERIRDEQSDQVPDTEEVWSLVGTEAIWSRVTRLIDAAQDEVVVIVGDDGRLTDEFLNTIDGVDDVGVVVVVPTDEAARHVCEHVPLVRTVVSPFDWLPDGGTAGTSIIGTILLVDDSRALVSTVPPDGEERAVIGTGHHNGLVALVRGVTDFVIGQ